MKRKLLLILLVIISLFAFAACDDNNYESDTRNPETGFDANSDTVLSAYDEAQSLGFQGTLEEFIALISGKDGADVVIPSFRIENAELLISYDDGETWSSLGKIQENNSTVDDDGLSGGEGEAGNDDYNYTWSNTEVLIELNEHSNYDELSSGVRKYYAGADADCSDNIDTAIRQRNKDATNYTSVNAKYTYLADGVDDYSWGANIGRLQQLTNVGGSDCPDVFVNFAYDLTCAQIRGCFANLLDKSWELGNHFYFANNEIPATDDYFDSKAGQGYFYEYMKSLSLTPNTKLYCLASNYTLDAVRAMVVIPVNVNLMNSIITTEVLNGLAGDRDGDGDHDIVDFYKLVWNNEWTYNVLAAYSNTVFSGNLKESENTDFADDVVGFILGTNSDIYGAAMLYSSSVRIVNYNEVTKKYDYPLNDNPFDEFAVALSNLMTQNVAKGICTVDRATARKYDPTVTSEFMGIRHKFAASGVLFGGTIMVGSLEDTDYQAMRDGSGFGVVPVPLYKTYEEGVNEYNTLVHNKARIVAIARHSTVKSQASAYLDYMSRNSADILEEYYTVQLTATVDGVVDDNNVKMMTFIRNHVHTGFDNMCDNLIAYEMSHRSSGVNIPETEASRQRWHYMLYMDNFQLPGLTVHYYAYNHKKQSELSQICNKWSKLD